jgi:hypothetical protein
VTLNDQCDHLDPGGRDALHRALLASQEDLEAGRLVDAEEVQQRKGVERYVQAISSTRSAPKK